MDVHVVCDVLVLSIQLCWILSPHDGCGCVFERVHAFYSIETDYFLQFRPGSLTEKYPQNRDRDIIEEAVSY